MAPGVAVFPSVETLTLIHLNRRTELEAWDVEQELRHAFAG